MLNRFKPITKDTSQRNHNSSYHGEFESISSTEQSEYVYQIKYHDYEEKIYSEIHKCQQMTSFLRLKLKDPVRFMNEINQIKKNNPNNYEAQAQLNQRIHHEQYIQNPSTLTFDQKFVKTIQKHLKALSLDFTQPQLVLQYDQGGNNNDQRIRKYQKMHEYIQLEYYVIKIKKCHLAKSPSAIKNLRKYVGKFVAASCFKYPRKKFKLQLDLDECESGVILALLACFRRLKNISEVVWKNYKFKASKEARDLPTTDSKKTFIRRSIREQQQQQQARVFAAFKELLSANAESIQGLSFDQMKLLAYIPYLKNAKSLKVIQNRSNSTASARQINSLSNLLIKIGNLKHLQLENLDLRKKFIVEALAGKKIVSLKIKDCLLTDHQRLQSIAPSLQFLSLVINIGNPNLNFPMIFKKIKKMKHLLIKVPNGSYQLDQFSKCIPKKCQMKELMLLNQCKMKNTIEDQILEKMPKLQQFACPKEAKKMKRSDGNLQITILDRQDRQDRTPCIKIQYRSYE